MFNWNSHMRGPGFPAHSHPMMPMSGSQMPYQAAHHPQWAQQTGMGMMMGLGWSPTNQAPMFPQLMPGMMNMPVSHTMLGGMGPSGGVGPAPPSQPPPPLPAEPPPPSPSAPKTRPPTPPPPQPQPPPPPVTDTGPPQQPGKTSKWDQAKKEQTQSAENAPSQGQSKPSQSPSTSQTKPAVSPAPGQVKASVGPHGPPPGQDKPCGPAPGQVNPRGPGQVNPRGPAPGQVNPRGPTPGQVNPCGPAPGQVNPHGSSPGQVNPRDPAPGQVNPRGQASHQVSPRGQASHQVSPRGPAPRQTIPPQGPAAGASNPAQDAALGQSSVASDQQTALDKAEPDPVLVAELEKIKLEEALFVEQYRQWKQQYDDWRAQNQNHPNKEQFGQYLEQWKTYEQQMESRRTNIHRQKLELEEKLLRMSAASSSKTDPARVGSFVQSFTAVDSSQDSSGKSQSFKAGDSSQDSSGKSLWNQSDQKDTQNASLSSRDTADRDREHGLVLPRGQRAGASGTGPGQRFSSGVGPAVPARVHQFAENTGHGDKSAPVFHNQGPGMTDEEKGEEDMNLDDDEAEGGGIIEGVQQSDDNAWQGNKTTDEESLKKRSGGDWNSWHQTQEEDQWGGIAPASARDSEWADQTGSHTGLQEPLASFRGQDRDGWNDDSPSVRPPFGSGEPSQDVDSRFPRPAGTSSFLERNDGYGREAYNESYYEHGNDDDDLRNFPQTGLAGMGQFNRGSEHDFHRGRGGDFLTGRGRGADFQRGMGVDFYRGRGGSFPAGRGDGPRGRGSEFPGGMGTDYQNEDRGRMFNNSFRPEGFDREGGPPRGTGGLAARGRGLPSLMSFELNNRNQLADFDLRERDTAGQVVQGRNDADYENVLGSRSRGGLREMGGQSYLNDDDEYESSRSAPAPGRGIGLRGGLERGGGALRGGGRFVNEPFDNSNQGDLVLGQGAMPWRGSMTNSSLMDSQLGGDYPRRPPLPSVGGIKDEQEVDSKRLPEGSELHKSGELNSRDSVSARGQMTNPDKNAWNSQPGDKMPDRYGQQEIAAAGGSVQGSGREMTRRPPDGDVEPEAKRGRFQLEENRDENRPRPAYAGERFRDPVDRLRDFRDPYFRDPYVDPYTARPLYNFDRPGFDRFGGAAAGYEPHPERKRLLPAESIDYGHGGIDREKKSVHQPAKVIDYGHGQSTEVKTADLDLGAGQEDRPSADIMRGGAELRGAVRESQDRSWMSELRDKEASLRRTDVPGRGSDLPPRYDRRGDDFADRDHRLFDVAAGQPGASSFRSWFNDDDFRDDSRGSRVPTRERDRIAEEEDNRGHRRSGFGSRDDGWRSSDKDSDAARVLGRDDVRSTGPDRILHDYSYRGDAYYGRRNDMRDRRINDPYVDRSGDYIRDREEGQGGDSLGGRDSRYGSSGPDPYGRSDASGHVQDSRDHFSQPLSPAAHDSAVLSTTADTPPQIKAESVKVEDLLCSPNRKSRPPQIVIIIRGLPGSGKTYVSKLLREKEISCGGSAPRMLCLDDYFMVDLEKDVLDPDTNKKVKKRVLEYEYEQALEDTYRQSLLKSFKKTIDDGFFPFIILDATNDKVGHFSEFWSYAKSKGFQVYVGELSVDVPTCIQRNIHHWTEWDIEKVKGNWETLPTHYIRLDLRWLLQEDSIPEVVMEDSQTEKAEEEKNAKKEVEEEEEEDDESDSKKPAYKKSRWELDTSEETLDKLDGIRVSKKHIAEHQSLNDYLQLDQMDEDYFERESVPGKKRVRWADLEEKKNQDRRRNLGFIVGQTQQDWDRITDDDLANKALNQTKYFYKN